MSLFFDGDLHAGISKAVQQSKRVLCFVSDGGEESEKWEKGWLQDHNFPTMIESKAVALRLEAESQQAGYLAAFCPFDTTPFLAVIYQGQVEERFNSGITKNDFTRKLLFALNRKGPPVRQQQQQPLGPSTTADAAAAVASTEPPISAPQTPAAEPGAGTLSNFQNPTSSVPEQPPSSIPNTTDPQRSASPTTASLYADRRARLEAQQRAERAHTAERARIRRQEEEQAAASSNPNTLPKNRTYAEEQRKRKQEQQRDLERIRRQVENDRAERREKAERERAIRREIEARERDEVLDNGGAAENVARASTHARTSSAGSGAAAGAAPGTTRIQVRLLDGSALRTTFPSTTLLSDLRWHIDSKRTDGSHPYTLKVLLTPRPPRILTDVDGDCTLQELDLHPSSTLLMNPVQGLAAAYQQRPADAAQTVLGVMWGYVLAFSMMIVGMIRTFLGIGVRAAAEAEGSLDARVEGRRGMSAKEDQAAARASGTSGTKNNAGNAGGIRIRTLQDQSGSEQRNKGKDRDRDEQQLYNGGGLNFEPRRDTEDDNSDLS